MRALKIFFIVFVLIAGFGLFSQYAEAQEAIWFAAITGGSLTSCGYRGGYHGYRGGYGYSYRIIMILDITISILLPSLLGYGYGWLRLWLWLRLSIQYSAYYGYGEIKLK